MKTINLTVLAVVAIYLLAVPLALSQAEPRQPAPRKAA